MKKIKSSLFSAALLGLCLQVAPALAQWTRTCVSAARGSDGNSCHCTTPCRTFQAALNATIAGGEITVLDPGGYGALTITKAISVVNDGVGEASIVVYSDQPTGVMINAAGGDIVNLRGLTITGVGYGGVDGIVFNAGKSLTVENCVIRNLPGNGISFFPNASSNLAVSNTLVTDHGGNGVLVFPSGSGSVKAVLNRVEAYNNGGNGLFANGSSSTGSINVSVLETVSANNGSVGIGVSSTSAASSLMIVRSAAANNGSGIAATGANATLRIGQSAVTGNTVSWSAAGSGTLRSYVDNNIDGNGDGDPIPLPTVKK